MLRGVQTFRQELERSSPGEDGGIAGWRLTGDCCFQVQRTPGSALGRRWARSRRSSWRWWIHSPTDAKHPELRFRARLTERTPEVELTLV